jgi:carbon-monoxide dehydrogenase large subunit
MARDSEGEGHQGSREGWVSPDETWATQPGLRQGSILGHRVLRTEDPRFLLGVAQYTEDVPADGALHAVFVRSSIAHARITSIDTAEAAGMPGVVGIFTGADLQLPRMKAEGDAPEVMGRPVLATDTVRFVGESIAVVVAETRAQAVDAADAVVVDYDSLPAVVDAMAAIEDGAPLLFPEHGSNRLVVEEYDQVDGALEGADVVVEARFRNQRLAPAPMEPNAALVVPDADTGGVTAWIPCQAPHWVRKDLARVLGLEREQVRVIAPSVGGGFGAKVGTYPEHMVTAVVAVRLGRAVRFVETRSENMVAMTHGRDQIQDIQVGATTEGVITGIRIRVVADAGAYPFGGVFLPSLTRQMSCGVYRVPKVDFQYVCAMTNKTPIDAYRGAGRPEAAAMLERAMDLLAAEVGVDPAEVRRRNFIPPDAFPIKTFTGAHYDVGDYERPLRMALEMAGYEELRREQQARRERGDLKQLGIGISTYVEVTGFGSEYGAVDVHPDGTATIKIGISPHGQGHETAIAQLVEGLLGIPMDRVTVIHSDTGTIPRGNGTMGSRSLQVGGSAVWGAGRVVLEKARRVAAHLLEADAEDVVHLDDGRFGISGAPDRSLGWPEIAAAAHDGVRLPDGVEEGLDAEGDFDAGGTTYPFGSHVAVAEVDTQTGDARLVRMIAVDDCGRILNPVLVDGQVHGGVAQGAAQALYEGVEYDDEGNPLTGSFMSYAFPSAAELPSFEIAHTETPTHMNPIGAKGIGESGTIGSTPAVQNAVIDAVSHLGVRHIDMPLSPERVWRAIREAKAAG